MAELRHTFEWQLRAPVARVFAALSEPAQLKAWFADDVDVEPRAGGAYRFWGRHVYGAPKTGSQRLTHYAADEGLAFSWDLHGAPSLVTLSLAPGDPATNAEGTTLNGSHVFSEPPPINRAREMVDDLWRILNGLLSAHLAGEPPASRPDYADPHPEVRLTTMVKAPVDQVFAAFVEPSLLKAWMQAPDPVVEPRVGGRYSYGWSYELDGRQVTSGPTQVLDFEPNRRLVIDWPDWRGDARVPDQRITYLFDDMGDQTRVTLIHDGFVRTVDVSDFPFGWAGFGRMLQAQFPAAASPGA